MDGPPETKYKLDPGAELRIEVDFKKSISVVLKSGDAECFGTELVLENDYKFTGTKTCIHSWTGCVLTVTNASEAKIYIGEETTMIPYINVHGALQELRSGAHKFNSNGPTVMIVGPSDSGKTSLMSILANYAVRQEEQIALVDLDPARGNLCIPSAIGGVVIDKPIDITCGFYVDELAYQLYPLVYQCGSANYSDNTKLYKMNVHNLAQNFMKKMENDETVRQGGMLINTPSAYENDVDMLHYAISEFNPDYIFVISSERLYSDLKTKYDKNTHVTLVKLPKSGGITPRDDKYRKQLRDQRISQYFYGRNREFAPHKITLDLINVSRLYRIGGNPNVPKSAMPIGEESKLDPTKKTLITTLTTGELQHCIVGVCADSDENNLLDSNVAGFLHITEIFPEQKRIQCLAPRSGGFKCKILVTSRIKWSDI